jgi:hypothetical protein
MPRQIQGSQTDFSFGEIDVALKRADQHPARKGGLRQMANARILNSGAIQDRPGRRALYPVTNGGLRTERFTIASGATFDIQFAPGRVKIIDFPSGATVANFTAKDGGTPLPWATAADIDSIVYAIFNQTITICFGHAMRPQVLTWDGVATWSISDFHELQTPGGQKRTPFYRLSPQNVTMLPSAENGAITVQFSQPIVVAGMVGTHVRFAGRQILLGSVIDSQTMNATVIESLPPAQILALGSAVGTFSIGDELVGSSGAAGIIITTPTVQTLHFSGLQNLPNVGDTVTGSVSGATGVITSSSFNFVYNVSLNTGTAFVDSDILSGTWGGSSLVAASPVNLTVQLLQNTVNANSFAVNDTVSSPSGSGVVASFTATIPQAVSVWDDEVMNDFRGYPASVFVDQFRLGFCDFPSIPGGIGWSAINSPTDLYVDANPDNAIFEIAPAKVRVLYIVPGPESSEFVFCDTKLYYIPISPTNPLKPGSVQFLLLSGDGCAPVQPRVAQEALLYVNAGQNSMMAVIATGAYNRPFNTKNLSDFHAHLFSGIKAIAAPSADGTFNERYAYVMNGDGSIVVGKYNPESLQTNIPVIGWGPWSGGGVVNWVAAFNASVLFTSSYFGAGVCEALDDTQYLDCALPVNAAPAPFAPPAGQGPLWFIAGQTVTLIDQVTRVMGTYQIDANGFIVPQFNGGEDLTIASLVAGQPWTMTVEPFAPNSQPGADMHQRMTLRQISNFAVYVINSTGFMFASLFSAKQTPTTPPLGTIQQFRRVPAWNVGDDATKPPLLRETVETWPPPGSSFDPRVAIIKDMPGPLQILEFGMEVSL